MMDMRDAYEILVGKPEGKRLLERPGRREKNNAKTRLSEVRRVLDSAG
jgi:hypothetical protein